MAQNIGRTFVIFVSAAAVFFLSSCTSMHVSMTVQRAPVMDTSGIRRIAVMPFEASDSTSLQQEIARAITSASSSRIAETRHFIMVDSAEIQRLQDRGENIENHVDALFTGQIVTLNVRDFSRPVLRYNPVSRAMVEVTEFVREVELAFSYSLRRTRDGSIIGVVTKMGLNRDTSENRGSLRSASNLAHAIVVNRLSTLAQDVAPHTVTERRTLMTDKSSKNLKLSMENAFALVRAGNYRGAINTYLEIYDAYGNFPAIYNAAILHEVLGEPQIALAIFQRYHAETGNSRAQAEINRLGLRLEELGLLADAYRDVQTQQERATAFAVNEIIANLPGGSRVWLYNDSRAEISLANAVLIDVSSALMGRGITVVDRDTARLRSMEMELQMLGNVRDEDIVSIGNAAGANVIAVISIEGTGHMRRLQVRLIDIELGVPLMTSDTGENWNI